MEEIIREIKGCMNQIAATDPKITGTEAFYRAVHARNGTDIVDGYSPLQWALGRALDTEGRTYGAPGVVWTETLDEEDAKSGKDFTSRMIADEAAVRELYRSREARAIHTRNRDTRVPSPGDLVDSRRKKNNGAHGTAGAGVVSPEATSSLRPVFGAPEPEPEALPKRRRTQKSSP